MKRRITLLASLAFAVAGSLAPARAQGTGDTCTLCPVPGQAPDGPSGGVGVSVAATDTDTDTETDIPTGARAPASDTLTTKFTVNGLPVILRRNTANEVVAANLYLLGGTRQVTADDAGIELLLLAASERGTKRYPGARVRLALETLGSAITIDPEEDWTRFGFHAVRATFDSTWAIFADRVMAPTLADGEVELVRQQLLAGARGLRDSPDALVSYLADSAAFAGHPYGLSTTGTERSLARITPAALRRYHDTQLVTSRMLLVVVGNVDRARVERLVAATLATLPKGEYTWTPARPDSARSAGLVVVPRQLPTNYILGRYAGPPAASPDYQALRVATAVLGGRLFTEIRSRRNLTYAVDAPFEERAFAVGGLYVTTVAPDTTIAIMREEIARLKRESLAPDALKRLVQGFITQSLLDSETNAEQGDMLARAELYRGDYRVASGYVDELRRVTPADVRRVANAYLRDIRWAYIGDPSRVPRQRMTGL